uniref:Isopenicillin N synthase-like Fe(2+) 2OG dioxygenase domain-containing protein n=1 Tax=Solanum lycopersicum TaxID=4081 RepID=A0A3Q7IWP5_SOLLC
MIHHDVSRITLHVNPIKAALVVNIGDSLQIMSNDRYKSIEHLFVNPIFDIFIGTFLQMLKDGERTSVQTCLVFILLRLFLP